MATISLEPEDEWKLIKKNQSFKNSSPLPFNEPVYHDKIRFVCMSDTHSKCHAFEGKIPDGDVFLHCGDFTCFGSAQEVEQFNTFLGWLPHPHKIVIAGNHELTFDEEFLPMTGEPTRNYHVSRTQLSADREHVKKKKLNHISQLLTNCTYLMDNETTVFGLRIYGSPWQPEFCEWAFNVERGEKILGKWNKIPEGIDVLMTHGPPLGRGDIYKHRKHVGCGHLLSTVQKRVKPKFHIFGHIHEGRDRKLNPDGGFSSDGVTTYINASCLNHKCLPEFLPVVFDIPLPSGITKGYSDEEASGIKLSKARKNKKFCHVM